MALKLTVEDINEIPETLRELYEEKDGKHVLKVEGVEDTSGLKSALEKERRAAREAEKARKAWEGLGKSPDEIKELLKAQEEADRKKAEKEGDHQKVLQQHQRKWEDEKKALENELNAARASERNAIISTSLMAALTKAGATEEGIDLIPDRLATRIKYETEDGKRVIRIMSADGETPLAGAGKDGTATFDDLVKEAVSKWPSLFKGSGASGSGTRQSKSAGGSGYSKRSDFKNERERSEFIDKHGLDAYKALPD